MDFIETLLYPVTAAAGVVGIYLTAEMILRMVIVVAIGAIAIRLLSKRIDAALEKVTALEPVMTHVKKGVHIAMWLLVIVLTISFSGLDIASVVAMQYIGMVIRIVVMLVIGMFVIRLTLRILDSVLDGKKGLVAVRMYLKNFVRIGLYMLLGIMVISAMGVDVTSIIALFSVAGLAISLALQNTLSNLAGGMQVLLSKPFEVGDYIDTEKGSGTVQEIGLAYSRLTTVDNKEILIPNNQIAASKIVNYTSTGARRVDINVTASYDAPIQAVRTALMEVAAQYPQIKATPAPEFYVTEYGASSISYTIRSWVDTGDYWTVYFGMMEDIRPAFEKYNIEMTYDHLNVHVIK